MSKNRYYRRNITDNIGILDHDLTFTLSESILSLVVNKPSSKSIWDCFHEHSSQDSMANATNLQFQLLDISKDTNFKSEYLQQAKSLFDYLAAINRPISDL